MARLLCVAARCSRESDGSPAAADEVHDERDNGKDQQQVNEETADMQNEESAKPEHDQYNRKYDKHENPLS